MAREVADLTTAGVHRQLKPRQGGMQALEMAPSPNRTRSWSAILMLH